MIKWIVVYWVTVISYKTVLIKHDSRCQCYVEPAYDSNLTTDTARVEFKKRKSAIAFMKNNCADFTGCRLDSIKIAGRKQPGHGKIKIKKAAKKFTVLGCPG